jgi:hypothetical protein
MNLVAAPREFFAEGRRENAATADGGITGDADFQWGGHA